MTVEIRYYCPWCERWLWMKDNQECLEHKLEHNKGRKEVVQSEQERLAIKKF